MIYRIVDVASVAVIALPITWVFLALWGNWFQTHPVGMWMRPEQV